MADHHRVKCRAQVSVSCYDGRPERSIYRDGMDDDGTWDPETQSVVCDPCYIAIGQPLRADLEDAIARAKERKT